MRTYAAPCIHTVHVQFLKLTTDCYCVSGLSRFNRTGQKRSSAGFVEMCQLRGLRLVSTSSWSNFDVHFRPQKCKFYHSLFLKKVNSTIGLLSLGLYAPGPLGVIKGLQMLQRARFWAMFQVLGVERRSKNVPLFQDRKQLTFRSSLQDNHERHIRITITRNPPRTFLDTHRCIFWPIYRTELVSFQNNSPISGRNTARLG